MTQEQLHARLDKMEAELASLRADLAALKAGRHVTVERIRAAFAQTDSGPRKPPPPDPAYVYEGQDDAALRTRQLAADERWAASRQGTIDAPRVSPAFPPENDAKHA